MLLQFIKQRVGLGLDGKELKCEGHFKYWLEGRTVNLLELLVIKVLAWDAGHLGQFPALTQTSCMTGDESLQQRFSKLPQAFGGAVSKSLSQLWKAQPLILVSVYPSVKWG